MVSGQRVVVVDGLSETEAVLKAVLEPRGLQVTRIRAHDTAELLRDGQPPNVVVVHGTARDDGTPRDSLWELIPRVVIGNTSNENCTLASEGRVATYYLAKPFQYPELIHAIERLL